MRLPDIPPVWFLGSAAAAWGLSVAVPVVRFDWPNGPGWALAGLGVAWAGWAVWLLRRNRTTLEPSGTPSTLVTGGPYRLNRNPIYTGMTLALFGWAVVLGTLTGFLPALVFPAVITRRFIRHEEQALRRAFGDRAEAWMAERRRW